MCACLFDLYYVFIENVQVFEILQRLQPVTLEAANVSDLQFDKGRQFREFAIDGRQGGSQ